MDVEATEGQAELAERMLALESGSRVLDVPCGEGRMSIALAARGHQVTGVDLNEELVALARGRATERGVRATFETRDMRDLPWSSEFDAVLCWLGSFGYFEDDQNQAFLDVASRALRPGGRLLLETHVAETILPVFQPQGWIRQGDLVVLQERRYDHERGRVDTDWTFVREGSPSEVRHSSIRVYTYREVAEMLRRAGLEDVTGFDSTTGDPLAVGSARLAIVGSRAS